MSNRRKIRNGQPGFRMVCEAHGPKPIGATFGDVAPGDCVKKLFEHPSGQDEYMWVHVETVGPHDWRND